MLLSGLFLQVFKNAFSLVLGSVAAAQYPTSFNMFTVKNSRCLCFTQNSNYYQNNTHDYR